MNSLVRAQVPPNCDGASCSGIEWGSISRDPKNEPKWGWKSTLDKQASLINSSVRWLARETRGLVGHHTTHWKEKRKPWTLNGVSESAKLRRSRKCLPGYTDRMGRFSSNLNPTFFKDGKTGRVHVDRVRRVGSSRWSAGFSLSRHELFSDRLKPALQQFHALQIVYQTLDPHRGGK